MLKISLSVKKNSTKTSNKIIIIKQHYSYNSRKNYTFKTFPYFSWRFNKNNVNFISIDVSKLKDNDKNKLKTTLDLENLTTYYGAIIENNDVLRKIYLKDIETNDNEKIMQMLAYYGVLENSKEYLNDYNYKMGVEALNNGLIYSANSYLKSVDKDYKDVNELLKDKRFFLLNKYHYDYPDNIRKMTFQYLPNDKIYHDSFVGEEYNQKAYVKNDIILS